MLSLKSNNNQTITCNQTTIKQLPAIKQLIEIKQQSEPTIPNLLYSLLHININFTKQLLWPFGYRKFLVAHNYNGHNKSHRPYMLLHNLNTNFKNPI